MSAVDAVHCLSVICTTPCVHREVESVAVHFHNWLELGLWGSVKLVEVFRGHSHSIVVVLLGLKSCLAHACRETADRKLLFPLNLREWTYRHHVAAVWTMQEWAI